jgi:methylglutaconyl-CoA hydratase
MAPHVIIPRRDGALAVLTLADPERRNALSLGMLQELAAALDALDGDRSATVLLLRGTGSCFCAGFDMEAAAANPALLGEFILRLSALLRGLRRLPQVVVAAVNGPAIAGGCALVSACDVVLAAPEARFGYPVHRLGISPVVSYPTLAQAIEPGAARRLQMSGEIVTAEQARALGLVWRVAASGAALEDEAAAVCRTLLSHGPAALRATKAWLNELDGSLDDHRFDAPARDSARQSGDPETARMVRDSWRGRAAGPPARAS